MSLSDIMGRAGLAGYAEVALVLFMLVFAAVAWRLFRPGADGARRFAEASEIPLRDDSPLSAPADVQEHEE